MTGEAKHTPGPWSIDPSARSTIIRDPSGAYIAEADIGAMDAGYDDALHDLRLIAAAPALKDAAADALAGWRYIRRQHGDLYGVAWDRVETALSAAISLATGDEGGR